MFFERLNKSYPSLKFTLECSSQEISFLYVTVKLDYNEFVTDLYCKRADCHQYLHYNSCHPELMNKSSVYSQRLCI